MLGNSLSGAIKLTKNTTDFLTNIAILDMAFNLMHMEVFRYLKVVGFMKT